MKVLIIIPAYNEEKNILDVVNTVKEFRMKHTENQVDYIVINDGSIDDTENICKKNSINVITLAMNLGIGGAVQTGYILAQKKGYDIAIQFDGDGQHDINYLDRLIEPIILGQADFTIGSRFLENTSEFRSTAIRRVGIKYLSFLIKSLTRKRITDPTSGFRAANRKVIQYFAMNYPIDYPEPESIVTLLNLNFKIKEMPVNMFERIGGKSSIDIGKSLYYIMKETCAIYCASVKRKGEEKR